MFKFIAFRVIKGCAEVIIGIIVIGAIVFIGIENPNCILFRRYGVSCRFAVVEVVNEGHSVCKYTEFYFGLLEDYRVVKTAVVTFRNEGDADFVLVVAVCFCKFCDRLLVYSKCARFFKFCDLNITNNNFFSVRQNEQDVFFKSYVGVYAIADDVIFAVFIICKIFKRNSAVCAVCTFHTAENAIVSAVFKFSPTMSSCSEINGFVFPFFSADTAGSANRCVTVLRAGALFFGYPFESCVAGIFHRYFGFIVITAGARSCARTFAVK